MQVSAEDTTVIADCAVVVAFVVAQPLQSKERLRPVSQQRFAQVNLITAELRIGMIAVKAIRLSKPRSRLASDLFTLQHSVKIQDVQAWHEFDVALRAMRVAYLAPQHLEATANPHERLTS